MRLRNCFAFTTSVIGLSVAYESTSGARDTVPSNSECLETCKAIGQKGIGVYYAGHPLYTKGNSHWSSASDQNSTCVAEPANAKDVSTILKIVAKASAPFGVRSGGHTTNPGFSSTTGVQIALFKLSQVTYHPAPLAADGSAGTVEIGAGLVWDDVYAALTPHGVTAVGARATGVGVGGFILGGGYGFTSNQYGLAIDTVKAFEVVLPSGKVTTASETKNPDLFWGLKGGFNNFGIVTKFTLLAFPQKQVWGGMQTFVGEQVSAVNQATVDFISNVKDPKASILHSVFSAPVNGSQVIGMNLMLFYDGPSPPAGIFERYTSLPHISANISTRSMNSLLTSSPSNLTYGLRATFASVSLKTYTLPLVQQVQNQTLFWGQKTLKEGTMLSYTVEPFLPSMTKRNKGGAYPHDNFLLPLDINWFWTNEKDDELFRSMAKESSQTILQQAIAEGQDIAGDKQIQYANYSPGDQDLKSIYGPNLDRLRMLRKKYDPDNIMGLTGGFRF